MPTTRAIARRAALAAVALATAIIATPASAADLLAVDSYDVPTASAGLTDIVTGPDGNLWFTEQWANKIGRITPAGAVTEFALPDGTGPHDIVAGPDGNLWFTESSANRIGRMTPGGALTEFDLPTNPGSPTRLAASADGRLWYTKPWSPGFVGAITTEGVVVEEFGLDGVPTGITVAPDGAVWVTTPQRNTVVRFVFGASSTSYTPYLIPRPNVGATSIVVDPLGFAWFTESDWGAIGVVTPAGAIQEILLDSEDAMPTDLTVAPDGSVWFTAFNSSQIGHALLGSGTIDEHPLPAAGAGPRAITVGPDGNLWFVSETGNTIGKATLSAVSKGSGDTTATVAIGSAIVISVTPTVEFGSIAVGATKLGTPNPASASVATNGGAYTLSVTRTPFGGGDIPLSVAVTPPDGATASATGQVDIPTSGLLALGRRPDGPAVTADEWRPVYQLGPVPFRPAGATSATVTYTVVAQ